MFRLIRHLPGRAHVFLVLMLVFASVVPGAAHAAAMSSMAIVSSGEHHVGGSVDQSLKKHHHAKDGHSSASHGHRPAHHGDMTDRCCPISCFPALCLLDSPMEAVFIRGTFEFGPALNFVAISMAMPERPPRD